MQNEKKGITVKIDADLHAEVKAFIEQNNMTMADFVTAALQDELHPKNNISEENNMKENMRTMAFQVPESLFQRIKDYLQRNNISQKDFVLGLITNELDREQTARQAQTASKAQVEDVGEEQDETPTEAVLEDGEGESEDEDEELTEETTLTDESLPPDIEEDEPTEDEETEDEDITEDDDETQGFGISM